MTHVANCVPIHKSGDVFRIYFNSRNSENRSSIGAVDIDIVTMQIVKEVLPPVFEYGPQGSYFEYGVSIGNLYVVDDITYMSFMGWQFPEIGHWFGEVGRLRVNQDFSLSLDSIEPMLGLDEVDNLSISYPWIEKIGSSYHMWYGSTSTWDAGNNEMLHTFKHATSNDGLNWLKKGDSIPYELGHAQAFSRPTVLVKNDGSLTMWFSYRSGGDALYRIGESKLDNNGVWSKVVPAPGLTVSEEGWDSEMVEYPYVFSHLDKIYMLYNGNGYGKSGFGLAVLESESA